ncbi:MAG: alginate export family protein [Leptospiraceae bacterium]|nr:alginate export family protein [Leptospiraceae bacterium]
MRKQVFFKAFYFLFFLPSILWSQTIEQTDLVPLPQLAPLPYSEATVNVHGFNGGLSALNAASYDTGLNQWLLLGFYRPFFNYIYRENHRFLLRGKWALVQYTQDVKIDSVTIERKKLSSSVGSLEVASAELNFAAQKLTFGRAFYLLGRGLLFANFADGLQYQRFSFWGDYRLLILYSGEYGKNLCALGIAGCGGQNPYDIVPGRALDAQLTNAGRRLFVGGEVTSIPLYGSRISTAVLYSKDFNTQKNLEGRQFTYEPLYLSFASRGFFLDPRLRYLLEYIYATGNTINEGPANKKSLISAHALLADIFYSLPFLPEKLRALASLQYAFGSGDGDRANGFDAAQVNRNQHDNAFFYFGAFAGGFALKPRLTNIHILRPGFLIRPLGNFYAARQLLLSLKYSYYRKVITDGPISDPRAKEKESFIGHGLDTTISYDFRSDLKFFYAFGLFAPGDAYEKGERKTRQAHIFSVTLNF